MGKKAQTNTEFQLLTSALCLDHGVTEWFELEVRVEREDGSSPVPDHLSPTGDHQAQMSLISSASWHEMDSSHKTLELWNEAQQVMVGESTEVVVKRHKNVLPAPALKHTFSCKVFSFLDPFLDHNLASVSLCWDLPFQVIWSLFPLQKLLGWGELSLSGAFLLSVDKVQPQPLVNQRSHLEQQKILTTI